MRSISRVSSQKHFPFALRLATRYRCIAVMQIGHIAIVYLMPVFSYQPAAGNM